MKVGHIAPLAGEFIILGARSLCQCSRIVSPSLPNRIAAPKKRDNLTAQYQDDMNIPHQLQYVLWPFFTSFWYFQARRSNQAYPASIRLCFQGKKILEWDLFKLRKRINFGKHNNESNATTATVIAILSESGDLKQLANGLPQYIFHA